ncbi:MAG: hypothetical protein ABJA34_09975 [Pseudonocardiales bacterium]
MANDKPSTTGRAVPGGPMAGALGFALLSAGLLRLWRRWRQR